MKINKQDIEKERKIIKELQRQLAEKDKEIEELRFEKRNVFGLIKTMEVKVAGVTKEKIQEIRKQVCDEIKKELSRGYPHFDWEDMKDSYLYDISGKEIYDVLDKIEKGE